MSLIGSVHGKIAMFMVTFGLTVQATLEFILFVLLSFKNIAANDQKPIVIVYFQIKFYRLAVTIRDVTTPHF